MRKLLLFLLVSIALPALAQNGKKVYADFHGVRYTRQHDGKLGRWEMYANRAASILLGGGNVLVVMMLFLQRRTA